MTPLRTRLGLSKRKLKNEPAGFIREPVTVEEQKALVKWLNWRARRGMSVGVKVLRKFATKFVRSVDFKASKKCAEHYLEKWNVERGKPEVFPLFSKKR